VKTRGSFHTDLFRSLCEKIAKKLALLDRLQNFAEFSHSLDPRRSFEIRPMNGRYRPECDRRWNVTIAPYAVVRTPRISAIGNPPHQRDRGGGANCHDLNQSRASLKQLRSNPGAGLEVAATIVGFGIRVLNPSRPGSRQRSNKPSTGSMWWWFKG
jgi:hypothetical protein